MQAWAISVAKVWRSLCRAFVLVLRVGWVDACSEGLLGVVKE